MIKVYGIVASRALRTLWMCAELGIEHELVTTDTRSGATRTPEYLKLNPNGHVPVIDDGGFILYESMAINLYLAQKHADKGLWPADLKQQALCYQWSFWGMMECEGLLLQVLQHRVLLPADRRSEDKAVQAIENLQKPFKVLNDYLAGRQFLVGEKFTVADLNVAAILNWTKGGKVDLAAHPNLNAWLNACTGRPTFKAALKKGA
jgi:glutathione S-transferase